jgi:hypothetical protein
MMMGGLTRILHRSSDEGQVWRMDRDWERRGDPQISQMGADFLGGEGERGRNFGDVA